MVRIVIPTMAIPVIKGSGAAQAAGGGPLRPVLMMTKEDPFIHAMLPLSSWRSGFMDSAGTQRNQSTTTSIAHNMVTTAFDLEGYRIVRNLGLVRGIIVRSRSIVGTLGASLQTLVGGNITLLTNLCEETREHAFDLMLQHAAEVGGNAVIGMRYEATEVMQGVTEVLAYGTAVYVERAS